MKSCRALIAGALLLLVSIVSLPPAHGAPTVRIKDIASVQGLRDNQLVGVGLVTGPVSYTHLTLPTN